MMENYAQKRAGVMDSELIRFHIKHLELFLKRFSVFINHYKTPSSALFSNELFLVVEAASSIAKKDADNWGESSDDTGDLHRLNMYLLEFENLKSGTIDIASGVRKCLAALQFQS